MKEEGTERGREEKRRMVKERRMREGKGTKRNLQEALSGFSKYSIGPLNTKDISYHFCFSFEK